MEKKNVVSSPELLKTKDEEMVAALKAQGYLCVREGDYYVFFVDSDFSQVVANKFGQNKYFFENTLKF